MSLRTLLLLSLAAVVITSLGGFLLVRYGKAKYEAGALACQLDKTEAYAKRLKDGNVIIRQGRREQEVFSDSDIDRELKRLNVMREDSDL